MKKRLILVFATFFIGAFFYVTTHGATNVVSFPDGAKNLQTITANTDAIIKNWADTLIIGSLEKNAGGCRIKSGTFYIDYTQVHFWQGYYWGSATAIATSTTDNSCICPTGTTRILRRSQANNQISELDTTWWKDFRWVNRGLGFGIQGELVWTTQCTKFYNTCCPGGCMTGDPGCSCAYNLNNCKSLFSNGQGTGCGGSQPIYYTEYLYNCVATSETLKQ
ncbi:MAG TPA: hypothetical protein PK960_01050 [bacterium]|nr:hypothetical protein [bacterium]HRU90006.1 hypothetical protein [Patescibacteria group bacterium]